MLVILRGQRTEHRDANCFNFNFQFQFLFSHHHIIYSCFLVTIFPDYFLYSHELIWDSGVIL